MYYLIKTKGSFYNEIRSSLKYYQCLNPLVCCQRRLFEYFHSRSNKFYTNKAFNQKINENYTRLLSAPTSKQPPFGGVLKRKSSTKQITPPSTRFKTLNILGTPVCFPYQPYDVQLELMTKVIMALNSKQHALLESPTAWQMKHKGIRVEKPIIYYGTRTQKQVSQVVKELRENSPYLPKVAILGSREHYCIHPAVVQASDKYEKCKLLCKAISNQKRDLILEKINKLRSTSSLDSSKTNGLKPEHNEGSKLNQEEENSTIKVNHENKLENPLQDENYCVYKVDDYTLANSIINTKFLSSLRQNNMTKFSKETLSSSIWDMEDLILGGKKVIGCPYFTSRILAGGADIVFCPYNYLISPSIRRAMDIKLDGNIVIFDEAHNIEDTAREASSLDIPETILNKIHAELQIVDFELEARVIKFFIKTLIEFMKSDSDSVMSEIEQDKEQRVWHPKYFWNFLAESGVDKNKLSHVTQSVGKLRLKISERLIFKKVKDPSNSENPNIPNKLADPNDLENSAWELASVVPDSSFQLVEDILELLQSLSKNEECYQIAVVKKLTRRNNWLVSLGIWCQDSSISFSPLTSAAHSVILASGTLTPLDTFSKELNSQFNHTLEGLHVINKNQVWAGVLPVGPNAIQLRGTYQNAQLVDYQDGLGNSILNIIKKVPNGVLCFFPSYSSMNQLISRWKFTGLWSELILIKPVLIEPSKNGPEFETVLLEYRSLTKQRGALLFGVFRGKFSEGIDFRDNECRCVLSIGIPFPFLNDLRMACKRCYNNKRVKSRGMLNGDDWYKIQGYRAINQALGRCIRHKSDWGAIILLECRFLQFTNKSFLSKWILNSISSYLSFEEAIFSLDQFMQNHSMPGKFHSADNSTPLKTGPAKSQLALPLLRKKLKVTGKT